MIKFCEDEILPLSNKISSSLKVKIILTVE